MKHLTTLLLLFISLKPLAEVVTPEQIEVLRRSTRPNIDYSYSRSKDSFSIELAYTMNPNPLKVGDLTGFNGQITMYEKDFSWIAHFANTTTTLDKSINLTGDFDSSLETISYTEIGIGLSRRSNFISEVIDNDKIFEELSFSVGVTSADSVILQTPLSGFGLQSSYGIYWRSSSRIHFGVKGSYHISTLQDTTDPLTLIDYTANWFAFNASIALYF